MRNQRIVLSFVEIQTQIYMLPFGQYPETVLEMPLLFLSWAESRDKHWPLNLEC